MFRERIFQNKVRNKTTVSNQTRMFVFENVKSCGKSEKNLEKCIEKCEKSIETFEKIGLFFTPLRI
jgi:hypothetical protein